MTTNLKFLKEKIEGLTNFHQIEILRILDNAKNVTLNENKNGVFVNLTNIDASVIEVIEKYLLYVNKQEKQLDIIENQKENLANIFFKDNKDITNTDIKHAPV